jgi:hypothetical protein
MSRVVMHLVREALAELADENYQREVWLASHGPRVGSVLEASERLFDDSGLGDALNRPDALVFDGPTDAGLRRLQRMVQGVIEIDGTVFDVLASRDLREVRELAAQMLFSLVRRDAELSRRTSE